MMYSSVLMHGGMGIFVALRALCGFLTVIGGFLLVVWAVKHLPAQKLKEVGLWLFAVGVVGAVLLSAIGLAAHAELANDGMMNDKMMNRGEKMRARGMMWNDGR